MLGSTPDSYAMRPSGAGATGYSPAINGYNGYAPLGAFSITQGAPTAGVNGYRNSIDVTRAWAEYMTPVGQIRFGRMPSHWGLGMLVNSGDKLDDDYQSNADRIMFDGFPRNLEQAQVLDTGLRETDKRLDFAIFLQIDEEQDELFGGEEHAGILAIGLC